VVRWGIGAVIEAEFTIKALVGHTLEVLPLKPTNVALLGIKALKQ
jgi:hypothetical protein